jgi:hypothetical protein
MCIWDNQFLSLEHIPSLFCKFQSIEQLEGGKELTHTNLTQISLRICITVSLSSWHTTDIALAEIVI